MAAVLAVVVRAISVAVVIVEREVVRSAVRTDTVADALVVDRGEFVRVSEIVPIAIPHHVELAFVHALGLVDPVLFFQGFDAFRVVLIFLLHEPNDEVLDAFTPLLHLHAGPDGTGVGFGLLQSFLVG